MDFRAFDSSIILILRAGILMSIGDFPESTDLSRIMLVGRLGVVTKASCICMYIYIYILYMYISLSIYIYICYSNIAILSCVPSLLVQGAAPPAALAPAAAPRGAPRRRAAPQLATGSFHNFKSKNFKLSVSNPKK